MHATEVICGILLAINEAIFTRPVATACSIQHVAGCPALFMAGELLVAGLRDFFLLAILAAILVSGAAGQPAPIPAPFNAIDSEETTEPTGEWTLTDTLCYVVSSFIAASLR